MKALALLRLDGATVYWCMCECMHALQQHTAGLSAFYPAPGFYKGRIAEAIVAALAERGGVMAAEDLAAHRSHPTRPVHSTYRGHTIYEIPPPVAVRAWSLNPTIEPNHTGVGLASPRTCLLRVQGCVG